MATFKTRDQIPQPLNAALLVERNFFSLCKNSLKYWLFLHVQIVQKCSDSKIELFKQKTPTDVLVYTSLSKLSQMLLTSHMHRQKEKIFPILRWYAHLSLDPKSEIKIRNTTVLVLHKHT